MVGPELKPLPEGAVAQKMPLEIIPKMNTLLQDASRVAKNALDLVSEKLPGGPLRDALLSATNPKNITSVKLDAEGNTYSMEMQFKGKAVRLTINISPDSMGIALTDLKNKEIQTLQQIGNNISLTQAKM